MWGRASALLTTGGGRWAVGGEDDYSLQRPDRPGAWSPSGPYFPARSLGVVILQGTHVEALRAQRANRRDCRRRARESGDARNPLHHRDAADGAIVEERLTAERRVDDQVDLPVHH